MMNTSLISIWSSSHPWSFNFVLIFFMFLLDPWFTCIFHEIIVQIASLCYVELIAMLKIMYFFELKLNRTLLCMKTKLPFSLCLSFCVDCKLCLWSSLLEDVNASMCISAWFWFLPIFDFEFLGEHERMNKESLIFFPRVDDNRWINLLVFVSFFNLNDMCGMWLLVNIRYLGRGTCTRSPQACTMDF